MNPIMLSDLSSEELPEEAVKLMRLKGIRSYAWKRPDSIAMVTSCKARAFRCGIEVGDASARRVDAVRRTHTVQEYLASRRADIDSQIDQRSYSFLIEPVQSLAAARSGSSDVC